MAGMVESLRMPLWLNGDGFSRGIEMDLEDNGVSFQMKPDDEMKEFYDWSELQKLRDYREMIRLMREECINQGWVAMESQDEINESLQKRMYWLEDRVDWLYTRVPRSDKKTYPEQGSNPFFSIPGAPNSVKEQINPTPFDLENAEIRRIIRTTPDKLKEYEQSMNYLTRLVEEMKKMRTGEDCDED